MVDVATAEAPALSALTSEQLGHWRLTGDMPSADPSTPAADSSPASPAEPGVSTDTTDPPASEPGTPIKLKTEARFQELLADRATLREKNAALEARLSALERRTADVSPAVSSPAAPDLQQTLASPDVSRPMLSEEKFWEQFPAATVGDFARYIARYELRADSQERSIHQTKQQRVQGFESAIQKKLTENPAFWSGIDPRIVALTPIDALPSGVTPVAGNVIAQEIIQSPLAIPLMEHLSAHKDVLDSLAALPNAVAIAKAIGRLEASLEQTSVPASTVVPKTTTSAPTPATTLGRKPASASNEVAAALKSGDVRAYFAAKNREELAQ